MAFQPTDSLRNRTFWGLIIAQFLAGFNDQFIHAAAMFYAINQGILTEAQAISLMPILFYAPWAIFCTVAGFLADRYSKTFSLVAWKVAEVIIALMALLGFYLGTVHGNPVGPWLVLSTVFMMGTHAAFFAPAKYGSMPEILQPHVLSRGNGILESTTFLAAILGTVSGGLLSFFFRNQEYWIGITLLLLALIGAAASFLIAYLPPGNPTRLFPTNLYGPLLDNLKILFRSRPLALAVSGIAFFIFMTAYMRQVMYMHGETRNPSWSELKTSVVVATVALGVGLGAPLAGVLSGGKVELGLVPLGTIGIFIASLFAGTFIDATLALVIGLVIIGFFSGFYMVPLYTLLQHRAPKTSKGDLIATSNFINVTGAIAASLLFYLLVLGGQASGVTPEIPEKDRLAAGTLEWKKEDDHKQLVAIRVATEAGQTRRFRQHRKGAKKEVDTSDPAETASDFLAHLVEEELEHDVLVDPIGHVKEGDRVIVSRYQRLARAAGGKPSLVTHYRVRRADQPLPTVYNNEGLPRYLFFGAALMAFGIQTLLRARLPDIFVRTLFWFRELGKYRIKIEGSHSLPPHGPVLLLTNCDGLEKNLQMMAATDRYTRFVVSDASAEDNVGGLLGRASRKVNTIEIGGGKWDASLEQAAEALRQEQLVAVNVEGPALTEELERFLRALRPRVPATLVPVYCGPLSRQQAKEEHLGLGQWIHVNFGSAIDPDAGLDDIRRRIQQLGDGTLAVGKDAIGAHLEG